MTEYMDARYLRAAQKRHNAVMPHRPPAKPDGTLSVDGVTVATVTHTDLTKDDDHADD